MPPIDQRSSKFTDLLDDLVYRKHQPDKRTATFQGLYCIDFPDSVFEVEPTLGIFWRDEFVIEGVLPVFSPSYCRRWGRFRSGR